MRHDGTYRPADVLETMGGILHLAWLQGGHQTLVGLSSGEIRSEGDDHEHAQHKQQESQTESQSLVTIEIQPQ